MRIFLIAAFAASVSTASIAAPVSYNGSQSTVQYNLPYVAGGVNWTGTQYIYGTKVIYDSATGTYTLRDTGSTTTTSTFTAANISSSTTDYTTYTKSSGGMTETFKVLNPGNSLVTLSYVSYGKWRRTGMSGTYFKNNDTYVVFGTPTTRAQMPHSGTATYSNVLYDGTWLNKDGVYSVSGSGTFNAYFGSNTLDFSANLTGTPDGGGATISFGAFSGTGSISSRGPTFSGSDTSFNPEGYKLSIKGGFYGPTASEIGGNFTLTGDRTHGGSGTGAFVGS
jgi:hypothetical protein